MLKEGVEGDEQMITASLKTLVKTKIASFAVPTVFLVSGSAISSLPQTQGCIINFVQIVPGLPKTRSGKIMRRILRKIAANRPEELGDISTLANPAVVEHIIKKHAAKIQA